MSINSVGVDLENVLSLRQWLESEDAQTAQRHLEEKITKILFSRDPTSPAFHMMAAKLAWIGSRPERKPFLEKEILALNLPSAELCGFFKEIGKAGRAFGHFVANHVVEIAIGVAICATGVGIAVATGYALSAAVGGVVVAGADSIFHSEEKPNPHIPPIPDPKACSQTEWAALQQDLANTLPQIDLPSSIDEILVTADGVWANGQFFSTDRIMNNSMFSSIFQKNISERSFEFSMDSKRSDWKTFLTSPSGQQEMNGDIPYQTRGERALALGNYSQAVHDLGKAIEANPTDPLSYLERGAAHFGLGEYDRSLEDYQQFVSQTQTTHPLSISEFCLGFAKGLPKGTYESGEGMLLFLVDFVKHPIETSKRAIDSITLLVDLIRKDEWGAVIEALSPEMHQLVTQWNTLPSDQRGELAGYAVGKHGADILVPGALAKVTSKSVKSAQELVAVCKNLQIVQETLVLETAAGMGNSAKIAEIVHTTKKTITLGEELGYNAREIAQFKATGKLDKTLAQASQRIAGDPAMLESMLKHDNARNALAKYAKKPILEGDIRKYIHETGFPTFPRPAGIPENYLVMVSEKGAGMMYVHPENTHVSIRVMPGKLHSPHPYQQKPYVIQLESGKAIDKSGKRVAPDSPEAHIPLEEFVYRK